MTQMKIEDQLFFINQTGQLEIAPPFKREKLRSKGKLLRFDDLTLPQRQIARNLGGLIESFMEKIGEIQRIAGERHEQKKHTDPQK